MNAELQPLVSVLRVFPDGGKYGDPYGFYATVRHPRVSEKDQGEHGGLHQDQERLRIGPLHSPVQEEKKTEVRERSRHKLPHSVSVFPGDKFIFSVTETTSNN